MATLTDNKRNRINSRTQSRVAFSGVKCRSAHLEAFVKKIDGKNPVAPSKLVLMYKGALLKADD